MTSEVTKFSNFSDFDIQEKQYGLSAHQGLQTHHVKSSSNFHFLEYRVYRFSACDLWWPKITFDLHV